MLLSKGLRVYQTRLDLPLQAEKDGHFVQNTCLPCGWQSLQVEETDLRYAAQNLEEALEKKKGN